MPLDFQSLSMMELRGAPGEVLDRVAQNHEAFIIERSGQQMACLVPLSVFLPDIQSARLAQEFEALDVESESRKVSITRDNELDLHFRREGAKNDVTITVRLPHGYPSASPKIFADPVVEGYPHRWQDGSLCIFGAMDIWNPGKHDAAHALRLARQWLSHYEEWRDSRTGEEEQ